MDYLTQSLTSFLQSFGNLLPGVLGAIIVLFIGWILASGLRKLTKRILNKSDLDNRILKGGPSGVSPENFLSKLVYYIVMVIVLLVVLEMLGVSQVLDPLKNMVNEFLSYIPNLIAAALIGFIGYLIANFVSELVGLGSSVVNNFSNRLGMTAENSSIDLITILKKLVFILIFIPFLVAAFEALSITAISEPATQMLSTFMEAIPKIFAAALIIAVFYILGKFLSGLLRDVLNGLGADHLAEVMHLKHVLGSQSLSGLIANIAFFFVVFFGVVTGIEKLGFVQLTNVLTEVMALSGRILFGLFLLVVGNYLAQLLYKILSNGRDGDFVASISRFATLGLFLGISLNAMGIADNIVNLAFGLTLGAVAVAVALSFGLGGREAAGKQMEYILSRFRGENHS